MCTVIASPSSRPTAEFSSGDSFASAKLQINKGQSQITVDLELALSGIPALVAKKLPKCNLRYFHETDRSCSDKNTSQVCCARECKPYSTDEKKLLPCGLFKNLLPWGIQR